MLAASAAAGAPLGHDFCALNLSDNLKPWSLIEKRLRLAVEADFAMAFYNPRSKARPDGFGRVLDVLRDVCEPARLMVFARAVSTPDQQIRAVHLADAKAEMADMRTVVLVGSSQTRQIQRAGAPVIYTPRSVPA
jgi:precorrin-3B C17-methyltransferase